MAKKSLGRDLGDLLARARPARIVHTANTPAAPGLEPAPERGAPVATSMPKVAPAPHSPLLIGLPAVAGPPTVTPQSAPQPAPARTHPTSPIPGEPPTEPLLYRPVRHPAFYYLLAADSILLATAGLLGFVGFISRSHAIAIIVLGGILALVALLLPPRRAPAANPREARVRVRLTRV